MKKIGKFSMWMIALLFMVNGCKKEEIINPPKLGETYQGGIVFFLDETGKHGLIASPVDQGSTYPWWNGSFVDTGASSATDGAANTKAIITAQGTLEIYGAYAANLCRAYRGGGFTDWFLPSMDQLNTLYGEKTLVGGFTNAIYWTSTAESIESVWVQDFANGQQLLDNPMDGANVHTRAIRAF